MKTLTKVILSVLAAVTLGACGLLNGQQATPTAGPAADAPVKPANQIVIEGRVMPRDYANLSFVSPGTVGAVLVSEGQVVEQGTVLIELDNRAQAEAGLKAAELEQLNAQQVLDQLQRSADVARAQAEKALLDAQLAAVEARQKLDVLDTDAFQQRIDDAKVRMDDSKEALDDAQEDVDKYKDLDEDNTTRSNAENVLEAAQLKYDSDVREYDRLVNEMEQARTAVSMAEAAQAEAQRDVDRRADGPDTETLALAEARLSQAQAQVPAAQQALGNTVIKAPYAGTVLQINISAGETALTGQTMVVFADLSTLYIETVDLTEIDVIDLEVGQEVEVVADALPDLTMTAVVEFDWGCVPREGRGRGLPCQTQAQRSRCAPALGHDGFGYLPEELTPALKTSTGVDQSSTCPLLSPCPYAERAAVVRRARKDIYETARELGQAHPFPCRA